MLTNAHRTQYTMFASFKKRLTWAIVFVLRSLVLKLLSSYLQ